MTTNNTTMTALFFIILQFVLVAGGVLLSAVLLRRKLPARYASWGWGALAWVSSQVLRMPLLIGLTALFQYTSLFPADADRTIVFWVNLIVLAGTSGPFEEIARYCVLTFGAKRTRGWREGVMFGAGHGGIEAVLLIGAACVSSLVLLTLGDTILAQQAALPAEQLAAVQAQIETARSAGPLVLVGVFERVFAMLFHIGMSVLVLRAVETGAKRWLALAIALHIGFNALAVIAQQYAGVAAAEAVIFLGGIGALIWTLRQRPRAGADTDAALSQA
jgi:uncharacterized membrane protein YhfC